MGQSQEGSGKGLVLMGPKEVDEATRRGLARLVVRCLMGTGCL
jgi:hypothetical protein